MARREKFDYVGSQKLEAEGVRGRRREMETGKPAGRNKGKSRIGCFSSVSQGCVQHVSKALNRDSRRRDELSEHSNREIGTVVLWGSSMRERDVLSGIDCPRV